MIPKEAFWSIAAVMGVFWIFGVVCDRLIIKWTESRTEPEENPDHERWEEDPDPSRACDTCKWIKKPLCDEPCFSCFNNSNWEKKKR